MSKCICPVCKSTNIIPIMYGMPAPEAFEEAEKGNLKLGGCIVYIGGGQPDCYCKDCEHEWCVKDFLVEDIVKIRFRYWSNWGCFSSESEEEGQWAFEVFPDGTIKYYAYPRLGRKVLDKDKVQIEVDRVMEFIRMLYGFIDLGRKLLIVRYVMGVVMNSSLHIKMGERKNFMGI